MAKTETIDFTSVGNTTWEVPFAATTAVVTCIGGGGGGYKDCTDDDLGGGGGGGGFSRSTVDITPGSILKVGIGKGGFTNSCNSRDGINGEDTFVTYSNNNPIARAYGGEGGFDNSGGGQGGVSDGDLTRSGQRGEDDDDGGKGGGAGNQNGSSGRCGGSRSGGQGTELDGTQGSCTGGQNGGTYGGGGGGSGNADTPGRGGQGAARIVYTYADPIIDYFEIFPAIQDSGNDGIPNDNTTFSWSTRYANDIKITYSGGTVATGLAATGTLPHNSGLQSVAGSSSPAQRVYTLTAKGPGGEVTATVTFQVYNDNCPNTFTIPDQLGKEPGEEIIIRTSPITGIDMVTSVVCGTGVQVQGGSGGFTTGTTIINGSTLTLRVYAEPFNTDENGLVNEKTVSVTIGCLTVSFKVQTRAPIVNELFDFGDNQFAYPYPKVDTREINEVLPDGGTYKAPTQYLNSPTIVEPNASQWQVELEKPYGVQIKAKDIRYSPPTTTSFNDISSQNNTNLEVNVQRSGDQPNNTWTKPNIA